MGNLQTVVKAYDIRGLVPEELDEDLTRELGAAFGILVLELDPTTRKIAMGRDMRNSSELLSVAFAEGVNSRGVDVIDIGLASTDMVYFASGRLGVPAAMLTASHNPSEYNGIKLCLAGARPVGEETGLKRIADLVSGGIKSAGRKGSLTNLDLSEDFAEHVRSFIDLENLKPLKVIADTANGMGGLVLPKVFEKLPVELEILYPELDGNFPNHPADPIKVENLGDLCNRVLETSADLGLAFDGDADRVFLVDQRGLPISSSLTTALVAERILKLEPGSKVVYNLICSRVVPEIIVECGGYPIRSRVGHSFMKSCMAAERASFGGEHSGHYYFRKNFGADSGLIAALITLEALSDHGGTLSSLVKPYERYVSSGEINFAVDNPTEMIDFVGKKWSDYPQDHLDGLTVDVGKWWFNLRPSNTEPFLRLNLEAGDQESCSVGISELEKLLVQ